MQVSSGFKNAAGPDNGFQHPADVRRDCCGVSLSGERIPQMACEKSTFRGDYLTSSSPYDTSLSYHFIGSHMGVYRVPRDVSK